MIIYIFISFILLIISTILCNKKKISLILFPFFWFLFFLTSNIYIISNYFTWKWIDESVIYQFFYWFEGAWLGSIKLIIFIWFWIFILWIIFSYISYFYIKKNLIKKNKNISIDFKTKDFKTNKNILVNFISIFFLFLSIIIHPISLNILELNWYYIWELSNIKYIWELNNTKFDDYYKIPSFQKATQNNKNLIFIYLESFENLYLDENLFPWLSNWLNQLKKESTYFSNIKQAYWAWRTIAWMVASQCWLPLITSWWWWNSMHWIDSFLSWAWCMWDFLKNAWYNLNYMWGASLDFAWKWNFYKTHWFNLIEWKKELEAKLTNKNNFTDWWLYDDNLFDLAYKKYEKLAESDEKFGLFMINMDTHWDKWVKSEKCRNIKYNDDENSILNSYKCSDYLISDFVQKIKNNVNFKNTSIVIVSDHFAMDNNNSVDILKKNQEDRRILFLILDSDNKNKSEINKNWSTLDIWATVLSNIWFNISQLGIWFNLLSSTWFTISDQIPNIVFSKWKKNYESFWSYPSIKNWFIIDTENKKILIDNKIIKFPALIELNKDLEIEKILWEDKDSPISLNENISNNIDSIYIDNCLDMNKICISYTKKDWEKIINEILNNKNISINKIENIFK